MSDGLDESPLVDGQRNPRDKLRQAIQEFVNDTYDEPGILTDWFLAYSSQYFRDDGKSAHRPNHETSDRSPHAAFGIAALELNNLESELNADPEDEDD